MSPKPATVKAGVGRIGRFHKVWLVPIAAIVIGLWMVYAHWMSQGPLIEISFVTASGIEAGKTKVKRKNVEIGEVLALRLSDDAESVLLSVRVHKENDDLLREDSSFWVVRPRVGPGGVSGLNTLLSGAYIEMSPGTAEDTAREFIGLEAPPVTPIGTPGLHVTLDADDDRSLNAGDPILFHGQQVGRIEYVHFNSEERRTYYNAFIAAPYDRLITTNTHFWFASGVSIEMSADGVRLDLAPIATIIGGGVAFDVPDGQPLGDRITERAFFRIHSRKSAINEDSYQHALTFVMLFEDSIRGLKPGAPVEFRGVKVGRVLRTDIDYAQVANLLEPGSRIPVMLEIVPAMLGYEDTPEHANMAAIRLDELIDNGLYGTLVTGSLITGQKYVDLEFSEMASTERVAFEGHKVIPSVRSQVGRLLESVANTANMLNKLPLDNMVTSAGKALDQTAETLKELDTILATDASHEVMTTLNETLLGFQQLAGDFANGSETHRDLQRSLRSLERTLVELEPVLRQLREKPNSLVFGADSEPDREPMGADQ